MSVHEIEPGDPEWDEGTVYRVYFWHRPPAPASISHENLNLHGDEYRLSRVADVGEVIDWARTTAKSDQTFTIYVQHRDGNSIGLIQLVGVDPVIPTPRRDEGLCVLLITVAAEKETFLDAHIAGVRDGTLVIAGGPARMNGLDPVKDVLREIPLTEIHRVDLLTDSSDDW